MPVGHEDGVVTVAFNPARRPDDLAGQDALEHLVVAVRPHQHQGAAELGAARGGGIHGLQRVPSPLHRHAEIAALAGFGRAIGCQLVAEGVESALELQALRELGIARAQGYHLGRPAPLAEQLKRL